MTMMLFWLLLRLLFSKGTSQVMVQIAPSLGRAQVLLVRQLVRSFQGVHTLKAMDLLFTVIRTLGR